MMKAEQKELLEALSCLFFKKAPPSLSEAAKTEAKKQFVYSLVAADYPALCTIKNNVQMIFKQSRVAAALGSVPYVVLKGLATAYYYPEPFRRTLGDIDIFVRPDDFDAAYRAFLSADFIAFDPPDSDERHVHFKCDGVVVELHKRFAELNTPARDRLLDRWICEAFPRLAHAEIEGQRFPLLPEPLNGITILAHIAQHLETGLGIRHILDFILYADRMLTDDRFPAFRAYSDRLGLTKLAVTVARIGQRDLGACRGDAWCRKADEGLCDALLEYCFACGNFGTKLGVNNTVAMILSQGENGFFRNLQSRGEENWDTLKDHPRLRPFAWIYQAGRYAKHGFERKNALAEFAKDYHAGRKRSRLMKALGIKRSGRKEADRS